MRRSRLAMVAIVKDEQHGIFEWVAHHAALGFDRFYIYDNGSTDRTLDEIAAVPPPARIRVIPWPRRHGQLPAYEHALASFGGRCDWMAFLDADEFLIPRRGETVLDILNDVRMHAGLAVPWASFGSSGHLTRPNGFVLESYLRRAPDDIDFNGFLKCIVRPDRVALKVTTPHLMTARTGTAIVLENGVPVDPATGGFLPVPFTARRLRVNHYIVKSWEDFQIKAARGLGTPAAEPRDGDFWVAVDRNDVVDESALVHVPALRAASEARRPPWVRRLRRMLWV